jgi:hypothetical protein
MPPCPISGVRIRSVRIAAAMLARPAARASPADGQASGTTSRQEAAGGFFIAK